LGNGGSVEVDAANLAGSGAIRANGGTNTGGFYGSGVGGDGGYVAVYVTGTDSGTVTLQASGGGPGTTGRVLRDGGRQQRVPGFVYTHHPADTNGYLRVYNTRDSSAPALRPTRLTTPSTTSTSPALLPSGGRG